jgi:hypothetical protein
MPEAALDTIRHMRRSIGATGVVEVLLSPLLTPAFAGVAWARSLWASRVLLRGQWGRYGGFHPQNILTWFFYCNQWLNLSRFGRDGRSPLIGLGDYPLSRWFHLSLPASAAYANAGAACTLLGTLAWVVLHLVWLDAADATWVLLVVCMFFISSTAFAMAFVRQNYNILGWMWLPLALYATLEGQWALAAVAWFAGSLASITLVFAALPLMLAQALLVGSAFPLAALLPALLKTALHAWPMLAGGAWRPALANMGKIIGLSPVGARYRRTSMRWRPFSVYFTAIYAAGTFLLWLDGSEPVLPLVALVLFVANQVLVRFADEQSVIVLFASVATAHVLAHPPSLSASAGLLLVLNPLPVFLGLCSFERDRTLVRVQPRHPFDHSRLMSAMETFLAAVPPGHRVLFAFDDPHGVYEDIFDGFRSLLELPLFVAASRGVHLFPDWHAVAETNHPGAPEFWGREPASALGQATRWKASHLIVYQDAGTPLDTAWHEAGCEPLSCFDWSRWVEELEGLTPWRPRVAPCWHLLRLPEPAAAV